MNCDICNRKFRDKKHLETHKNVSKTKYYIINEDKIYCSLCGLFVRDKNVFISHYEKCAEKTKIICENQNDKILEELNETIDPWKIEKEEEERKEKEKQKEKEKKEKEKQKEVERKEKKRQEKEERKEKEEEERKEKEKQKEVKRKEKERQEEEGRKEKERQEEREIIRIRARVKINDLV